MNLRNFFQKEFLNLIIFRLILSLGLVLLLSFLPSSIASTRTETTVTDPVTVVYTTDTSLFSTPNDPTDDTIDYTPNLDWTGQDTFTYQICDAISNCVEATVTVTVTPSILVSMFTDFNSKSPEASLGILEANDDSTSVIVNTALAPTFVNIHVLRNDDFGANGPSIGSITIFSPPSNGVATVSNGPRSPDPAGITYLSNSNQLVISDSEVDENFPSADYTGMNLFVTDLLGSLDTTLSTFDPPKPLPFTFTDEPTGVAYNPNNHHLFFSDDDSPRGVYELDPGLDGFYNTADDSVSFLNLQGFGSTDPEGLTYDSWREHVLVIDGVGEEVYDIDLFDGIINGNESVSHFDVSNLDINDPEGIAFNHENGHLYILSSSAPYLIAETTIDGLLFRYLSISYQSIRAPAGLGYAPGSGNPSQNNLYIVDRVVDNNTFPYENDGKMYEVSFIPDVPPAVDAGPDQTIVIFNNVDLNGTVVDGRNPPGSITTQWSKVSGPGKVIFGDANALETTASFEIPGVYELRLTADDGTRVGLDETMITVNPIPNEPPVVYAGPNQTIAISDILTLNGNVNDDGLPDPPNSVTTLWSKVSGPGTVVFANPDKVDTNASFSTHGIYVLRLTANDSELSSSDDITITVTENQTSNQPPTVNAGNDQSITLPNNAALDGTVTDDGLPSPPGTFSTLWSVISGPGLVTFADANAQDTTATFSTAGMYELLLTADDGEKSSFDSIKINVSPEQLKLTWLPIIVSH